MDISVIYRGDDGYEEARCDACGMGKSRTASPKRSRSQRGKTTCLRRCAWRATGIGA